MAQPQLSREDLDAAYAEMVSDEDPEAEALEWAEALTEDLASNACTS
ncbi:MAG: hypothetical protein IH853_12040 [Bacteroidetes bacterium]|nr:hypothetical protein [Bacteroidota bacterium]